MNDTLKPLSDFFSAIENDQRISITHIGIYAALLKYWMDQDFASPLVVFKSEIMQIAKVSSPKTYYKCIKELSEYGYINYKPSFKRTRGSKVSLTLVQK